MKLLNLISNIFVSCYFSSADPNLFGSKARRRDKERVANKFWRLASETQKDIDLAKTKNPFESASAKSAMTLASRKSKQAQNRMFNVMGAGATPEAMIAAQGSATEALAGTAGQIAAGAEASKAAEVANLRNLKASMQGQAAQADMSAASEHGTGWQTAFQGINALGSLFSGAGQGAGALSKAGII